MPAYTRGKKRDQLTFVLLNDIFCYGFRTKDLAAASGVSSADLSTQLGHMTATVASAIANRIMVTGANSPKPRRATKKIAGASVATQATTSTFIAYNKGVEAATAGWIIGSKGRSVLLTPAASTSKRSVSAVAVLSNGVYYAFPLNKADFTAYRASLGLLSAEEVNTNDEQKRVATGMSKTRPGRAATTAEGGGDFSTFYSTASKVPAAAANFVILSDEVVEFEGAAPPDPAPGP